MRFPIGTVFKPPKGFTWSGKVIGHVNGCYQIHWTDNHGNGRTYTETQLREIIKVCELSWTLPYVIGIDEDLFNI